MNNNNEDAREYNNIPTPDPRIKAPVEEGDVENQGKDTSNSPLGGAQNINEAPDSPLVDGNAEEANSGIEDTAEEA